MELFGFERLLGVGANRCFPFTETNIGVNKMDVQKDVVEELAVEELEERTSPGIFIAV